MAVKGAILEKKDIVETMVEVGRKYQNCGYGRRFYGWIAGVNHEPGKI